MFVCCIRMSIINNDYIIGCCMLSHYNFLKAVEPLLLIATHTHTQSDVVNAPVVFVFVERARIFKQWDNLSVYVVVDLSEQVTHQPNKTKHIYQAAINSRNNNNNNKWLECLLNDWNSFARQQKTLRARLPFLRQIWIIMACAARFSIVVIYSFDQNIPSDSAYRIPVCVHIQLM